MREKFELNELLSRQAISDRVKELGVEISKDFSKSQNLVCIAILKGSFIFAADLLRSLSIPAQIEFMGLKSYEGQQSTGRVQITMDLGIDIKDKDVLLIEDIVDTGTTLEFLNDTLQVREPASLKIATLLSKPEAHLNDFKLDYVGFEIADEFVVGYGLDVDGKYRELDHIAELKDAHS